MRLSSLVLRRVFIMILALLEAFIMLIWGNSRGFRPIADVDLEYGESSMGVTLILEDGDPKD